MRSSIKYSKKIAKFSTESTEKTCYTVFGGLVCEFFLYSMAPSGKNRLSNVCLDLDGQTGVIKVGMVKKNFDKDSWEIAQAYAGKLGEIPVSFSSTIRLLMMEYEQGSQKLSPANQSQTAMMLGSKSLHSMLHSAARLLFGDRLDNQSEVSKRELVTLFRPYELASILALAYLFRRSRRGVTTPLFDNRVSRLQLETNIGALIGSAIPIIGLPLGLLCGGTPILAEFPFAMHDPSGYDDYLKHRGDRPYQQDSEYEKARWGCTASQVAGCLLQLLGLGKVQVELFGHGLIVGDHFESIENEEIYKISLSRVWITALVETGRPPEITHRGAYYPRQVDLDTLLKKIQMVKESPTEFCWLTAVGEQD